MIEGLNMGIPARLKMMRPLITLGLMLMLLTSFPLWIGNSEFPRAIGDQFHPLLVSTEMTLYAASLFLFGASLILKYQRLLLSMGLLMVIILCLNDYNRIQPWLVCTVGLLIPFLLYNGRVDDANKYTAYFISVQLTLAIIYFLNGFYLLATDGVSIHEVLLPIQSIASDRQMAFILRISNIVPHVLLLNAVLLLIPSLRYLSVTFSVVVNLTLSLLIFTGNLHNPSLALFNLLIIPMLFLGFSGQTRDRYFSHVYLLKFPLFYALIICFLCFPIMRILNGEVSFTPVLNRGTHEIVSIPSDIHSSLSYYQKAFCKQSKYQCELDLTNWFRHEKTGELQIVYTQETQTPEPPPTSADLKNKLLIPVMQVSE
jgi:hypothetical protein